MKTYDLRSDFLAPAPDASIREMARAAKLPAGFGLREDPDQQALEREVAALLGKEDALLMPTCTMANLVAAAAQAHPGEAVVAEATSHCVLSEAGGLAAVAGGTLLTLTGTEGELPVGALREILARPPGTQSPRVALVILETTHNRAGGRPLPPEHLREVGELAAAHGAALHIDGARLLNACVALDVAPATMAAPATTLALSLNKGVGAPVGAMLAGSAEIIERALVLRQRFGGGIRPAGAIAAAGRAALEGHAARLARDHANAARLAVLLRDAGIEVRPVSPRTNILLLRGGSATDPLTAADLGRRGVLGFDFDGNWVRLCLHAGVSSDDIDPIANAIKAACAAKESRGD